MKLLILTTYDYPYHYYVYIFDTDTGIATELTENEECSLTIKYEDSYGNHEELEDIRKRALEKYGCDMFLFFEDGNLVCVERKGK